MNKYEAMIIYPEAFKDDALEVAFEKVRGEITKIGGEVEATTRLGRRTFARPMNKQNAGQFAVITFRLDGAKITHLQSRFKLNEDIFRVQIVRAEEKKPVAAQV